MNHSGGVGLRKRSLTYASLFVVAIDAFTSVPQHKYRTNLFESTVNSPDSPVTAISPLTPFFDAIANATTIRQANEGRQAHDSFRYEWGTWVNEDSLEYLMEVVNRIRISSDIYKKDQATRYRVASSDDWDCYLHVLPPQTAGWEGRAATGSWTVLKTLTGLAEIAALKGPDREGRYAIITKRDLKGGSDGSIGGSSALSGDDCIKYVGGPLRRYSGKYGKTVLLEVVIRPPVGLEMVNDETTTTQDLETIDSVLELFEDVEVVEEAVEERSAARNSTSTHLGYKMGMDFGEVGGLDKQLNAIARRVLASRANPKAARRLGVSHVRGILLSGPPGCGKTLLARELARLLGAREIQIVNGPEILDKYIGEAEKKVRELFAPAEQEYLIAGDDSALHIIILDEMDAIARKRGTMTSDTTGVRDSVVNQLLAKMDGVKTASNILVVGLTNRPELLDPALLRPGRLEVQLRVELPDKLGRRDILRIHTRQMRQEGGLDDAAINLLEDTGDFGIPSRTEHYSGAELAGLVRSAASFALARALDEATGDDVEGVVTAADIETAMKEVRPALGKQDEVLKQRFPIGISSYSSGMQRIMRELKRFSVKIKEGKTLSESLLLASGGESGGAGVTALAAWGAAEASRTDASDYVRFLTAIDLIIGSEGGGEDARAAALVEAFSEAREMSNSLLVLDDIDQICAGSGELGFSKVVLATLRALLRSPVANTMTAKAGGHSTPTGKGRSFRVIATTSQANAACSALSELFDETIGTI